MEGDPTLHLVRLIVYLRYALNCTVYETLVTRSIFVELLRISRFIRRRFVDMER